jgi:hypothetical protein
VASSVYSSRLFTQAGLLGTGASVTVPPGQVWIVKAITVYASAGAFDITSFLEDEPSGAALIEWSWSSLDAQSYAYYGALVFEPGAGFHFQVNTAGTAGVDVSASGYRLSS